MTDYSRHGLSYARHTNAAGDDIRLPHPATGLARSGSPTTTTGCSNSCTLAWMHYDETDDHFLGAEIIEDPAAIVQPQLLAGCGPALGRPSG